MAVLKFFCFFLVLKDKALRKDTSLALLSSEHSHPVFALCSWISEPQFHSHTYWGYNQPPRRSAGTLDDRESAARLKPAHCGLLSMVHVLTLDKPKPSVVR